MVQNYTIDPSRKHVLSEEEIEQLEAIDRNSNKTEYDEYCSYDDHCDKLAQLENDMYW